MAYTEGWSDDSQSTNATHQNHPNVNTGHHPIVTLILRFIFFNFLFSNYTALIDHNSHTNQRSQDQAAARSPDLLHTVPPGMLILLLISSSLDAVMCIILGG